MKKRFAKFKRKPIIVEAAQWNKGSPMLPGMDDGACGDWGCSEETPIIHMRDGDELWVNDGDWVIKEGRGRYSVMDQSEFEKTYEKISES